ncbi:WXG100 family type VII secretion target [Nocardia sp. NPDC051570]|uniref:WXG100 family type VII secretion target n=1 Tax=Nocardia sp. NPDC051570 TaxID=3364324 RepID=UPI003791F884
MTDQASTSFAVVPAAVQDAGRFVQATAEALVSGIHSADREIQGLMGTWRGQAASAYMAGWEETRKGALEVLEALDRMAELLGVTAVTFTDTDQSGATGMASTGLLDMQ